MKKRMYKLEILWEDGVLTETAITETEKELLKQYGREFVVLKYSLKGAENVKPVSFQVWDENDEPLLLLDTGDSKVLA